MGEKELNVQPYGGIEMNLLLLLFGRYVVCLIGKSSLLSALGNRELPIPDHIDIYHLQHEMAPSEKTALQCVMEVDAERFRLEHEAEQLSAMNSDGTLTLLAS